MSDSSGLTDGARADLNESAEPDEAVAGDSIPERPADGAPKAKWVDYVVALGADRRFVTEDTEHHDAELGEAVTEPGLSRDELIELADRLGG